MNNQTKKVLVLFALFIIPLVFYIFLSKGIYKHANLPILIEDVDDISTFSSEKKTLTFADNFNVVAFFGNDIATSRTALFNLNQIIYKRYQSKLWFQIVAVFPKGTEAEVATIKKEINRYSNTDKWQFVFATSQEIKQLFNSFQTPFTLNQNLYSKQTFIIDKKLRLRGRVDDENTIDGKLFGYDMESVANLKNKMKDDIDIIYYQYGKSAEKAKRYKRKI